jgi:hypothetical protein
VTEGSSGQPEAPKRPAAEDSEQPTAAEQDQTETDQKGSSSAAEEPAILRSRRRSNEFWLAVAGIVATFLVGVIGSWLAYSASMRQVGAESNRATNTFIREQKTAAYKEYLEDLSDLEDGEQRVCIVLKDVHFDIKKAEDELNKQDDAYHQFKRINNNVRLVASKDVAAARIAIRDKHKDIQTALFNLMQAAHEGPPEKAAAMAEDICKNQLDLTTQLVPHFLQVAQVDIFGSANY